MSNLFPRLVDGKYVVDFHGKTLEIEGDPSSGKPHQRFIERCPYCGKPMWFNSVPLTAFCWGTEENEHPEIAIDIPAPFNPYLPGYIVDASAEDLRLFALTFNNGDPESDTTTFAFVRAKDLEGAWYVMQDAARSIGFQFMTKRNKPWTQADANRAKELPIQLDPAKYSAGLLLSEIPESHMILLLASEKKAIPPSNEVMVSWL